MNDPHTRKRRRPVEGFDSDESENDNDLQNIDISAILEDHEENVLEGMLCEEGSLEVSASNQRHCGSEEIFHGKDSNQHIRQQTEDEESNQSLKRFVFNLDRSDGNLFGDSSVCVDSMSQNTGDILKMQYDDSSSAQPSHLMKEDHEASLNMSSRVDDHLKELYCASSYLIDTLNFNNLFPKAAGEKLPLNDSTEFTAAHECDTNDRTIDVPCEGEEATQPSDHEPTQLCSTPLKQPALLSFCVPLELFSPIKSEECGDSEESEKSDGGSTHTDAAESDQGSTEELSDNSNLEGEVLLEESFILNLLSDENVNDRCSQDNSEKDSILSKAYLLNDVKVHEANDLSVNEGIFLIMKLYVKNHMSKAGLHRAIQTTCKFLPDDHNLPTSSYKILSYIESLAPPVEANVHYYCYECLFYHGVSNIGQCCVCRCTKFGHFFNFDIDAFVKYYFEKRNLASIMDSKKANGDPSLKDLTDGSVYKLLNRDRNQYDVNVILNADGVRIRKASDSELWLVMGTIAEVPVHLQKSFITVLGVWYGPQKPDMKTFLKPFSEKMASLDRKGVKWVHPSYKTVQEIRVRLPVVVCDAPARAMIQNLKYFNGRNGCNICEIKTTRSAPVPDMRCIRVYPYKHNPQLRTKERMLRQALEVGKGDNVRKDNVKGVKGPSAFSLIPSVDVSQCMVPEYMHSVLLGVTKQLLTKWTNKQGNWCIKANISEIDIFLESVKHPDFVHRPQRQLKSLKFWKASDFLYFLLYESLPALSGRLPEEYLQHFLLLVKGIFTLLKSSITEEEITEADLLLKLFVNNFANLYGDRELTYNVHQLCHLGLCVRRYGPLFSHSAFPFEDMNGLIARKTHGTNFVDKEIVRNIRICLGIQILGSIVNNQKQSQNDFSQVELLGAEVSIPLTQEDLHMLHDESPKIFARAKLAYDVFTSEIYKPLKTANFYVMFTLNETEKYGSIKYFAKTGNSISICIRLLQADHTQVFYNIETLKTIEQIVPVKSTNEFIVVQLAEISLVKVGKIGNFVYKRPNLYHNIM